MLLYAWSWQALRAEVCGALNLRKTDTLLGILDRAYADRDVVFLQAGHRAYTAPQMSRVVGRTRPNTAA